MARLRITQKRSAIRRDFKQKRTLEALGLRRLSRPIIKEDSPQVRGMIYRVRHLVEVDEIE
jgi:large subunit ribosomal protein L30